MWLDRSIRTKGLVVVAIPVLALMGFIAAVFWFGNLSQNDQQDVVASQNLLTQTNFLQSAMNSGESNAIAYVLSGPGPAGDQFRNSYLASVRSAETYLQNVRAAATTAGDAKVVTAITQTSTDAGRTLSLLGRLVAQASSRQAAAHGSEPLVTFYRQQPSLQNDINRLLTLESQLVSQDQARADATRTAITLIAFLSLVAMGIAATLSLLFSRSVVLRINQIGRAVDSLDYGRGDQLMPVGSDEIGRLGRRLAESSALLRARQDERDRAQALLEDLLTASPVVSFRFDGASRALVYASPNVERLFGISADEAVRDATAFVSRIHPDDLALILPLFDRRRVHADERRDLMLRFQRDPHSDEWGVAEAVVTTIADDHGDLAAVVAYLVDVTDRQRAREAATYRRDLVESIFDASPDAITVRDRWGQVLLASGHAIDAIEAGAQRPQFPEATFELGGRLGQVAGQERARLERLVANSSTGLVTEPLRVQGWDEKGDPRTFEVRARPVVDAEGAITGTVAVTRDVSDQIKLENSLRDASAEARQANQAKSEFLSRMSHELRTPLNAILGFAQLLELDDLEAKQATSVRHIYRAGEHLLSLINEVLDISRIETGRLSLSEEPVAVAAAVEEVAALLAPVAESNGVHVQVELGDAAGLFVLADRQRLLQVLFNLGSNAIKYNTQGGVAVFRTHMTAGGGVVFSVSDTGPGIPRDLQSQLFVPFARLGAERTGVEGTGVGLALSKNLVELMGGKIGVESASGRGSTFWIQLRRVAGPAISSSGGGETAGGRGDRRPWASRVAPAAPIDATATPAALNPPAPPAPAPAAPTSIPAAVGGLRHEPTSMPPAQPVTPRSPSPAAAATPAAPAAGAPVAPAAANGNGGRSGRANGDARAGGRPAAAPVVANDDQFVVLHIEDNASNATLVEQILARRTRVRLLTAGQGGLGLDLARRYRPDLLLLDMHLPDINGDEVLLRIRADADLADLRVAIVSADATPGQVTRMRGLGVVDYLTKPVEVDGLLRLIDDEIDEKDLRGADEVHA